MLERLLENENSELTQLP